MFLEQLITTSIFKKFLSKFNFQVINLDQSIDRLFINSLTNKIPSNNL